MNYCDLCKKKEWRLALGMFGYDISKHEKIINSNLFVCYHCAAEFFASLINIINREKSGGNKIETVNSLIKRYNDKGKITKDELIDINLWLKKIKNIKDFKEDK